jgi:hypothetical protein
MNKIIKNVAQNYFISMHMKVKWVSCLDLDPIPKISHNASANISQTENI